ncbi:hypothetical protein LPJ54_005855 [Coemansia sp. RSA 1824]|nr:hypothetical protein LPJ54_005855 [Coemansia sp. RSA 1824]
MPAPVEPAPSTSVEAECLESVVSSQMPSMPAPVEPMPPMPVPVEPMPTEPMKPEPAPLPPMASDPMPVAPAPQPIMTESMSSKESALSPESSSQSVSSDCETDIILEDTPAFTGTPPPSVPTPAEPQIEFTEETNVVTVETPTFTGTPAPSMPMPSNNPAPNNMPKPANPEPMTTEEIECESEATMVDTPVFIKTQEPVMPTPVNQMPGLLQVIETSIASPIAVTSAATDAPIVEATAVQLREPETVTVTVNSDAPCSPVTVTLTEFFAVYPYTVPMGPGPVVWTNAPEVPMTTRISAIPAPPMPSAPPAATEIGEEHTEAPPAPCTSSWAKAF